MRNSFNGIALGQERITQKLVSDSKVRAELKGAFEWSDSLAVVMFFHVGCAQIEKRVSGRRVNLRCLAKLGYFGIDLMLFARLQARLHVLRRVGRRRLPHQPCPHEKTDHACSGSRTSRN